MGKTDELVQGASAFQTLALQERAALFATGTEGSNPAPSGGESVSLVEEMGSDGRTDRGTAGPRR
jgi:hypothetical protein